MKKLFWLSAFFLLFLPSSAHAANAFANSCSVLAADEVTKLDDSDCDHVADINDNCPQVKNGDCAERIFNCDINGDAELSDVELAGGNQIDSDTDGEGDACEASINTISNNNSDDQDGDGFENSLDNCSAISNVNQQDSDRDGRGNACDNCPFAVNPEQTDDNVNGVGDVCEKGAVSAYSSGDDSGQNSTGGNGPGAGGNYFFAGHEYMSGSGSQGCQQSLIPQSSQQSFAQILIFLLALASYRKWLTKKSRA